ncbi:MAG: Uma2 family endonuclease [Verrucomicrobiales bacterium]|jgi:Uma2 family endonuclease
MWIPIKERRHSCRFQWLGLDSSLGDRNVTIPWGDSSRFCIRWNHRITSDCVLATASRMRYYWGMVPTIAEIERTSPPFVDSTKLVYPDSDGKPMADNTRQFRYIATLKGGFDSYYRHRDDVFVAGDLLWYPVEGDNTTRYAPDVMIVFGRPPGDRGSYRQWEEAGVVPHVVFEILSPGNTVREIQAKFEAYERFGVTEYYVYDPDKGDLLGWVRDSGTGALDPVRDMQGWRSPLLEVTFRLDENHLVVTQPDGKEFLTHSQLSDLVDGERARAEGERARADTALAEVKHLKERLRALGFDPDRTST